MANLARCADWPVSVRRPDRPDRARHCCRHRTNGESLADHLLIPPNRSAAPDAHKPSRRQRATEHLKVTVETHSGHAALYAALICGAEWAPSNQLEYLFGKEMTMTHNSSNTIETDEIEFTAAYGTAIATTRTRQTDIRSHQQEPHPQADGNVTSDVDDDSTD